MATALKTRLLGSQSDERLVTLAHDGSQIAFEALARRYRRALLRHCRRLCLSEQGAQEVLQRSLAEAWSGIQADAEPRDLPAWLRGIAQRIAAEQMHGGAAASGPALDGAARDPDAPGMSAAAGGAPTPDEVLALRGALAAMTPRRERDDIVVHRMNGNKADLVSEDAFGLADAAVRGLLGRARRGISALTPPPLLAWALGRATESGPAGERIAELGAGGGAAGLALKGAIVAITAGVAITGAVVAQSKSRPHAGAHARRGDLVQPSSTDVSAQTPAAATHGVGLAAGDGSGDRRGGHRGSRRLIASVTSPGGTPTSAGQTTQGAGTGTGAVTGGATPSSQGAGNAQPAGGGQSPTAGTQGAAISGATPPAAPPAGSQSSRAGSTGQSGGEGIGVHISVGGESGQQAGGGGATGGAGSSSSGESSSSSESSKGTGIGISISLEPIASVGVHVSLP